MAEVEITDHSEEVKSEMQAAIERALEACGMQCEGYAKGNLWPGHGKDTGRLQNSITHTQEDDTTEIIGTNVEYAPYVELGTSRHPTPIPFLKPALQNHQAEYQRIFQAEFGKG